MRTIGRISLWIVFGILGSAFIGAIALWGIDLQSQPQIGLGGSVSTSFWDRGYVRATGTWVIEDSNQAFPWQTTEVTCYRDSKECYSAQAEIAFNTLSVQTDRLQIVTWDANTIVYTSNAPACVTYVYTISRNSERVTGQRRPKQNAGDSCKMLEQRVLNLTMRDGLQVWKQLQSKISSEVFPYMWVAIALWWAFVVYKIARVPRSPQLAV